MQSGASKFTLIKQSLDIPKDMPNTLRRYKLGGLTIPHKLVSIGEVPLPNGVVDVIKEVVVINRESLTEFVSLANKCIDSELFLNEIKIHNMNLFLEDIGLKIGK